MIAKLCVFFFPSSDELSARRRRRRVLNSQDVITSLSERTGRRSELSVHMENARRGVRKAVAGAKSKSDTERRKSSTPESEETIRNSFSDREHSNDDRTKIERSKTKTVDSKMSDSDRTAKRSASKNYDVSKKMEELTALGKETLARIERLTKSHGESRRTPEVDQAGNEEAKPFSILKKKYVEEVQPPSVHHLPVSILKRKSSQDEATTTTSTTTPVTFSPTVVDTITPRKKQGILKKRCSLDESHVDRRRSYSPDVTNDYRPILKTQRRSSLEEIIRTRSPDPIQGILKRKHSRGEEEFKDRSLGSPEPQSILKRKSGTSSSGSSVNSPHVSIATAVILAAAGGAEIVLDAETVRPILKKKSFEEYPNSDPPSDIPKPILKKKSSTETDDIEDRPKKPILKTSKKSSREEYSGEDSPRISMLRARSNHNSGESGSEAETVRPILKQSGSRESSPRLRLSFCNDENRSSPRRQKPVRRSYTVGDADLSSLSAKKSSEDEVEVKKPSVIEMVLSFEKSTGAIPKKSSLKSPRHRGRFSTQPITFDEFEATAR